MILPVNCPLWIMAVAIAFAVIFAKEIFGGTGMNIFNVALVARAFMFISYPSKMSGDTVWTANDSVLGLGNKLPEAFTAATPLAQAGVGQTPDVSLIDSIVGLIPGSVGETSVIAIFIGAAILLITGIASWKTMLSGRRHCSRSLSRSRTFYNLVVRASCAWRFLFRRSIYGNRPGYKRTNRRRQIYLRFANRHYSSYHKSSQSRLSRRHDVRNFNDEHVCPRNRLLLRTKQCATSYAQSEIA